MRKGSTKVLAKLCASFSRKAIIDALMDVKPLTKSELERLVDQLSKAPRVDSAVIQTRRRPSRRNDADGSPAARIKRLLTVEAGLSQEQSIDQLRLELVNLPGVFLPKKTSFDRWLDAVLSRVPAGEVLNAAMTIAARHTTR